jgi:hypothetical protein
MLHRKLDTMSTHSVKSIAKSKKFGTHFCDFLTKEKTEKNLDLKKM